MGRPVVAPGGPVPLLRAGDGTTCPEDRRPTNRRDAPAFGTSKSPEAVRSQPVKSSTGGPRPCSWLPFDDARGFGIFRYRRLLFRLNAGIKPYNDTKE